MLGEEVLGVFAPAMVVASDVGISSELRFALSEDCGSEKGSRCGRHDGKLLDDCFAGNTVRDAGSGYPAVIGIAAAPGFRVSLARLYFAPHEILC